MATYPEHNIRNTHYDEYLTNISVGYAGNADFIGERVIPVVNVDKQSDRYMVFDDQSFMIEDDSIERAPGTVASEMRTGFSDDSFYCKGYAKRYALYDEEIANADEERIGSLEENAARQVKDKLLLHKEINAANLLTNPQNFHADLRLTFDGTGTNPAKWSDFENSDPMYDILKQREKAERLGAPNLNTLVLSAPVYNILRLHPKLKSAYGSTFTLNHFVEDEDIKRLLEIDNLIIARARKATKDQQFVGKGGLTNYIWGNNAVLMYLPQSAGTRVPAAAYTFQWTNPQANVVGNQKTRRYYNEESKTLFIETEEWYAQKVVSTLGAVVLPDVVEPLVK